MSQGTNVKKCIVVTSIFPANEALIKFSKMPDFDLIIVGDKKSPPTYDINAIYLDIEKQQKYFSKMAEALPYNHYSRKNIGYLYAMSKGYEIIGETDDDNIPYSSWGTIPEDKTYSIATAPRFPNIYREFTNKFVWPRGMPLDLILTKIPIKKVKKSAKVMVWQGLADGNPDVDAIYRLVIGKEFKFNKVPPIVLDKGVVSAFNSQNTIWKQEAFVYTYLPHTVSFRYTDILRSFVAQYGIWALGGRIGFHNATVKQERNAHNLLKDFKDECEMYNSFYQVTEALDACELKGTPDDLMIMYKALAKIGIVKKEELITIKKWVQAFL